MVDFISVPATNRVPFVFVEVDNSRAESGPKVQDYRIACLGQRRSTGLVAANTAFRALSADQVAEAAGSGSVLHAMALALFRANKVAEAWFVGVADAGGGVAATKTLTVTGPATENGSLYLYVAGRRIVVPVVSGDSANTVAASINSAIAASDFAPELPVTAGVAANVVTLTARNAGTVGNDVDVRLNHALGEETPAGVTVVVAAGVAGATDPSFAAAIAALGDQQYNALAFGLGDTTTIGLAHAELADRFGPTRMIPGQAFFGKSDTHANLLTFASSLNSPHCHLNGWKSPLSPPWEAATSLAGVLAREAQRDPARPFTRLELPGVVGPALADRFTFEEREFLLRGGVATLVTDELGVSRVDRPITTYRTNAQGVKDESYLDANTLFTLDFLRYDFRRAFLSTYPRAKLADDGTRYGAGQPVVTPKIVRGFALTRFRAWEELGLVEGFSQFQRDLVVQRSSTDRNRLDVLLPADLVNQLLVTGTSIKFLL